MKLTEDQSNIIKELLAVEHTSIARMLGLVYETNNSITYELLTRAIGLLDNFSRINEERAKKIVVTISAILWTYREDNWDGLQEYLVLILSRIGFAPSAIMIDADFDSRESSFSGSNSMINEFCATIHQLKYEITIDNKKFLLTGFQKRVWEKLKELKLLGISAPTSAGKSFIILLKAIEQIIFKGGNIIYIVPTLSLVSQVCVDFNKQLKLFNIVDYKIATTFNSQEDNDNRIYVLTQEKAIAAFSQSSHPFRKISVLIVDEIQNIERVADDSDQRSKTLYDVLMEFRHSCNPGLTIISGPRVDGLKQLGIDIFDEKGSDEEKVKDSPVASFTYSISQSNKRYFFNQYTDIIQGHNSLGITKDFCIEGFGKSQYRENFLKYLASFIQNLGLDSHNVIFSPTTVQARKTAIELSKYCNVYRESDRINSLLDYLKETVHVDYDMCKSIPKGFVYHHGKTPTHVRSVVEKAVKDRLIPNVVCTTTLMQGVNLPAQNVILRNPDLAIKKRNGIKPKLTDYEIANLRGRAGRLLKDFIGRTFVLEENAFEKEDNQGDLFPEAEKELRSGYGEKYLSFSNEIQYDLVNNIPVSEANKEYSFLTTYIRQTILKHPKEGLQRLKATGIELTQNQIDIVANELSGLSVPRDVCYKNRYWDPIDLNLLYDQRNHFHLPMSIVDKDIDILLYNTLLEMRRNFGMYYKKHLDINENYLMSTCRSAKDWMKEKPLKFILSKPYINSSDKIEERISLLQGKISYGIPMLLKPLYDMKDSENMFLRFIEIGAYKPITRKMIEFNIPRETAIYLNSNFFINHQSNSSNLDELVHQVLRANINKIDYWRKVQFEGII
jgi:hypothetical protein